MKITRLDHAALICSDYEKSKGFYTKILGFEIRSEEYREERESHKAELALGGEYLLEIFTFPTSPARPSYPEACGLRHLAFEVADFDATLSFLQKNGVTTETVRMEEPKQRRFVFIHDPDGLPIEIVERA